MPNGAGLGERLGLPLAVLVGGLSACPGAVAGSLRDGVKDSLHTTQFAGAAGPGHVEHREHNAHVVELGLDGPVHMLLPCRGSRGISGVPWHRPGGPVRELLLLVVAVEVPGRCGKRLVGRQRSTTRPSSSAMAARNGRASSPSPSPDMRPPTAIITSTTRSGSVSTGCVAVDLHVAEGSLPGPTWWRRGAPQCRSGCGSRPTSPGR